MTTQTHTSPHPPRRSARIVATRIGWLVMWAFVTAFAWFQVVEHGGALLAAAAVGFFIAPDLTFLVGLGQPVEQGKLPTRAVPFYNAMHRLWPALAFTLAVGIGLAPMSTGARAMFVGGLSWVAHIALDRAAGYGLRNPDGSR